MVYNDTIDNTEGKNMGGNALKTNTRRMSKTEMENATIEVVKALSELGLKAYSIPYYRDKSSFGDIDLIVERDKEDLGDGIRYRNDDLIEMAVTRFHSRDCAPNTNILSFEYRQSVLDEEGFQVDLIMMPPSIVQTAVNYFSYNDLGNFLGRTAHKMGFKYGHEGLLYYVRDKEHLTEVLSVSKNQSDILAFLGYNPSTFFKGFDSLNEVFEYAVSTPFFNKSLFALENLNHKNRTRDRKRANYNAFLTFIECNTVPEYAYPDDKMEWLERAYSFFPHFQQQLIESQERHQREKEFKALFNGKLIMTYIPLKGKELGTFIGDFKQSLSGEEFNQLILTKNEELIKNSIVAFYEKHFSPKQKFKL